jgi:hypothetical protein
MTMIRIPGVKSYANEGERHFYLRRAGERIIDLVSQERIDPARDLSEFVARASNEMKAKLTGLPRMGRG